MIDPGPGFVYQGIQRPDPLALAEQGHLEAFTREDARVYTLKRKSSTARRARQMAQIARPGTGASGIQSDIALRDFGMSLGSLALARLSDAPQAEAP